MIRIRKIVCNNMYVLKMVLQINPTRIFFELGTALLSKITEFALYVLMVRYLLNALTLKEHYSNIIETVVVLLSLRLAAYLIQDLYNKYYAPTSDIKIKAYLHEKLYKKAAEMEVACYEDSEFYDKYVKAIEQAGLCVMDSLKIISQLVGTISYIILACSVIFTISKIVFLVLLVPICVGGFVSRQCNIVNKKIYDKNITNVRRKDYVNRVYNLRCYAEEIRTTRIPRLLLFRYEEAVKEIIDVLKHYGFSICALQYIFFLSNEVIADLLVFLYASYSALITKTVLLGDFYILIDSLGDVTWALRRVVDLLFKLDKNAIYIDYMREFLNYEPAIVNDSEGIGDIPDQFSLEFKSVSFRYSDKSDYVLNDVSFMINQKEKLLIVGENGSGKTTLVKLLLRLYDVNEGQILLNGHDIKEYSVEKYRELYGTMFQDFKLFALSIKDNILLSDNAEPDKEAAIIDSLKYTGIYDKVNEFNEGINAIITKEYTDKGVEFSLGEQQKLALVRMLMQDRKMLILDEPSSSLDPIAEHQVFETVCKRCDDKPVIFISHRLSSALLADKIIYIEKGRIEEMGTFKDLMDRQGKFYSMFNSQSANYIN